MALCRRASCVTVPPCVLTQAVRRQYTNVTARALQWAARPYMIALLTLLHTTGHAIECSCNPLAAAEGSQDRKPAVSLWQRNQQCICVCSPVSCARIRVRLLPVLVCLLIDNGSECVRSRAPLFVCRFSHTRGRIGAGRSSAARSF